MSVYTDFDRAKDELREELDYCLDTARKLMSNYKIDGYDEDEAEDIYFAIKKAKNII